MKIIGVIPSRFGSSRFPGKPLHPLAGKPLVAWVTEAVKRAGSLDDVIVATDDERIAAAVEAHGGKAVMTPSELPSGTDRIACAARNYLSAGLSALGSPSSSEDSQAVPVQTDFADDDILVNIQGDEPLIDPALIDALVIGRDEHFVERLRFLDRLDDPRDEGFAREHREGFAGKTTGAETARDDSVNHSG